MTNDIGKQFKELILSTFKKIDDEIDDFFKDKSKNMKKDSQGIITKFQRIYTGLMRKTVNSFATFGNGFKALTLESAAQQPKQDKIYSSFQEYGTDRGIKGILFVTNSFKQNTDNIEREIENIIERVGNAQ